MLSTEQYLRERLASIQQRMDAKKRKPNCTGERTIPCGNVCRLPENCSQAEVKSKAIIDVSTPRKVAAPMRFTKNRPDEEKRAAKIAKETLSNLKKEGKLDRYALRFIDEYGEDDFEKYREVVERDGEEEANRRLTEQLAEYGKRKARVEGEMWDAWDDRRQILAGAGHAIQVAVVLFRNLHAIPFPQLHDDVQKIHAVQL